MTSSDKETNRKWLRIALLDGAMLALDQAEQIAKSLAARFLENGNYEALGMPLSHAAASKYVQASAVTELDEFFKEEEGF